MNFYSAPSSHLPAADGVVRIALRDSRAKISMKDLSVAYDRVVFGLKSNIRLTPKEKEWTAYHEAGHAVLAYLEHPHDDVIKATIIPHKGALGFVSHRPAEEMFSSTKEHLIANIKVSVAAYVAERIKFGSTSSGVGGCPGSDFHTAMRYARYMVWSLGMGESGLIGDFESISRYYSSEALSNKTKETLDADVQKVLQTCITEVEQTLKTNWHVLEDFAQELLKREELEFDEIVAIFDRHGIQPATKKLLKS